MVIGSGSPKPNPVLTRHCQSPGANQYNPAVLYMMRRHAMQSWAFFFLLLLLFSLFPLSSIDCFQAIRNNLIVLYCLTDLINLFLVTHSEPQCISLFAFMSFSDNSSFCTGHFNHNSPIKSLFPLPPQGSIQQSDNKFYSGSSTAVTCLLLLWS